VKESLDQKKPSITGIEINFQNQMVAVCLPSLPDPHHSSSSAINIGKKGTPAPFMSWTASNSSLELIT
jgi:hypothetical protein